MADFVAEEFWEAVCATAKDFFDDDGFEEEFAEGFAEACEVDLDLQQQQLVVLHHLRYSSQLCCDLPAAEKSDDLCLKY